MMYEKRISSREYTFILKPAFALVSINITLSSRALASPSSMETCLWNSKFVHENIVDKTGKNIFYVEHQLDQLTEKESI